MYPLLNRLRSGRPLLMDGAMGTELQRRGISDKECYELWNLTHADEVRAVHQAYLDAGAECLLTHTFQANPAAQARHHQEAALEWICAAAVNNARSAGQGGHLVLADVGPAEFDAALFHRLLRALDGVDGVLLETWTTLPSFRPETDLPLLFSSTIVQAETPEARLEEVCNWANENKVAAVGMNCGRELTIPAMANLLRRLRQHTDLPLLARPNAGTPVRVIAGWVYPRGPTSMAAELPLLLEAGAALVGGCCGTTPAHIAAFRSILDSA